MTKEECPCQENGSFFDSKTDEVKLREVFNAAERDVYEYHIGDCAKKQIEELQKFEEEVIKKCNSLAVSAPEKEQSVPEEN